jgi:DNA replication and repair protein RecF
MRLVALRLSQFRNYTHAQLTPSPRVNILLGANAQGKTNLLEAIYYLSAFRPLRPVREVDLIQWGAQEMRLTPRSTNRTDCLTTFKSACRRRASARLASTSSPSPDRAHW